MAQTRDGGKPNVKQMPYATPQGPMGQMHEGVGLGGQNYGNGQKKVARGGEGGSPGLHGTNRGNSGTQK